ncbi:PREDICTED: uncharacterized protein LOC104733635 [Camelina sativa]|uniref:Uncharacterized protein LOC104733635 n=1 Tax=Camelina sativa TaxID=90675 RepID=A0ABM0V6A2_CAMSA|nr:PREDICTED: uncharacterized protein LOC104733635 [Camelina sativa]
MANNDWIIAYPSDRSEYLRFEGSDHRPLVTSFDHGKKKRKGIFRYDIRLKEKPEVTKLVKEVWTSDPEASVDHRLHLCRSAIIKWSKTQLQNSQKEISFLREQLEEAMCDDGSNQSFIDVINQKLLRAYIQEEEFWKQRSRQLWLALGHKNSGYFHAETKGIRALNTIYIIETPTEMNNSLIAMPTPMEIKDGCFSIHDDKAPGHDGFSASFFQTNWEIVTDETIVEVQSFFIT